MRVVTAFVILIIVSWGLIFIPALVIALVPNHLNGLVLAFIGLLPIYWPFIERMHDPVNIGIFIIVVLPTLILKILAISFRGRWDADLLRLLPFLGLLGPCCFLAYSDEIMAFFSLLEW